MTSGFEDALRAFPLLTQSRARRGRQMGGQEIDPLLSFGQGGSFWNWNWTRIDSFKGTTRVVSDAFH
jgi:hypothetical protein